MKKKNKSKNKSLIIVCVLLVVVGLFILFKASTWGIYKSLLSDIGDMHEVIDGYKNSEDITIEKKEADEYLEFEWFDVGNYFKQFKHEPSQTTEWNETYYQYDGEKKVGMFSVGTFESLLNGIKEDELVFIGGYDTSPRLDFSQMFYCNFDDFIEEKNIKDDVDLVREFAKYNYDKKYGIFTSLDKLREDYSIRLISSIALPSVDKIYYINGVHKGYMFELVNEEKGTRLYEVNLFKGGKRYILSVLSNNFNLDMMREVIGTIKLK